MAYIGKSPAVAALTASDVTDGIISNAKLAQDIISADTALGAAPADTDEFLVSDAGVLKRMDYSYIKAGGKILQVIGATTATQTDNNTNTYADTTLTADITCAATSSKVLVLAEVAGALHVAGDTSIDMKLLRDSTSLGFFAKNLGDTGTLAGSTGVYYFSVGNVGVNVLDSPSSTSALTYKVQFMSAGNTTGVRVQSQSSMSSIILMELGA